MVIMKAKKQYLLMALALMGTLTACNDYDPVAIGYEEVETTPSSTIANHPDLDPSWLMSEVINIGQHDNNVFVYNDNLLNSVFAQNLGWTGGDVQSSVKMDDGNILFVVRDAYYGVVDAATRARLSGNIVRNSMLILKTDGGNVSNPKAENLINLNKYVQTTDPSASGYYEGVPFMTHAKSQYHYWPGVATDYNGQIQVQMIAYRTTLQRRDASDIITYSKNGSVGEDYLQEVEKKTAFTNYIAYDDCLLKDNDGHNYLYCAYQLTGVNGVLVARTASHDLNSEWEFMLINTNGEQEWSKTIPTATATSASEEALRSNMLADNGSCQHPQVFKKGDWYYLVAQSYSNKADVRIWRSKTAYGPFSEPKTLCVIPEYVQKAGNKYYNSLTRVALHPSLSRSGELVLSTSQTANADADNFTFVGSADYCRPYFYRIYNWEHLFAE